MYINDIAQLKTQNFHLDFSLFADDTSLESFHSNVDTLNEIACTIMEDIQKWLIMNRLSLDPEKTY